MGNEVVDGLTGLRNPETMIFTLIVIFAIGALIYGAFILAMWLD